MSPRRILILAAAGLCAAGPLAALDIDRVRDGVVRVIVAYQPKGDPESIGVGTGSGFVINAEGYVVTNHHVIEELLSGNKGAIRILFDEQARDLGPELDREITGKDFKQAAIGYLFKRLPAAEIVWADERLDLALIKSEKPQGRPLPLAATGLVKEGDKVWVLGYPGSGDLTGPSSLVTLKSKDGVLVSKERFAAYDRPVYQVTAEIHHGNSGGPLLDDCGNVIGINTFTIGKSSSDPREAKEISRYAGRIDNLFATLANRRVAHTLASQRCVAAGASTTIVQRAGRDPLLIFGIVSALFLGVVAVVLAATRRGRERVKDVVSRTLHRKPKVPPARPQAPGPRAQALAARPAGPRPVLMGVSGEFAGAELELDEQGLAIGRDPRLCQLVFPPDNELVSKRHCTLHWVAAAQQVMLEDCWSTNGTFVGKGEALKPGLPRPLRAGERFYLGDPSVSFEVRFE